MDAENLLLVRTIIKIARELGVNVIAVGIENNKQLTDLKTLDCEFGQGYYFSSPVDVPAATDLILRQIG